MKMKLKILWVCSYSKFVFTLTWWPMFLTFARSPPKIFGIICILLKILPFKNAFLLSPSTTTPKLPLLNSHFCLLLLLLLLLLFLFLFLFLFFIFYFLFFIFYYFFNNILNSNNNFNNKTKTFGKPKYLAIEKIKKDLTAKIKTRGVNLG